MSIRAMVWALDAAISDPYAKLVLVALADHADDETYKCWPSVAYIAKRLGIGRSTTYRHIASLTDEGFIEHKPRRAPDGGSLSPVFTLKVGGVSQIGTPGGVPKTRGGVPTGGTTYEPSIEPPKNLTDSHSAPSGRIGNHSESHSHIGSQNRDDDGYSTQDGSFSSHDGVVVLSERELEKWAADFPRLDAASDLIGMIRHLYDWAAKNVEPKRRKAAIYNALKNKNDRVVFKERQATPLDPDGVMTWAQLRGIK